jgi:hypothetical protein
MLHREKCKTQKQCEVLSGNKVTVNSNNGPSMFMTRQTHS